MRTIPSAPKRTVSRLYDDLPRGTGLAVATIFVWAVAAFLTLLVGFAWLAMMNKANGAPQEAAASAIAAAVEIGIYIVARAASEVLATIRGMHA